MKRNAPAFSAGASQHAARGRRASYFITIIRRLWRWPFTTSW
jgi:hypothetical protein